MEQLLPHSPGMTVGLLGGSFDPPHDGHVHITREALRRFALDRVVWLVSPGNPLKRHGPAPLADRLAAARTMMDHPRVVISDYESRIDTRYTARTLRILRHAHPHLRFVWLMGADNLAQLHRWKDWHDLVHAVPIGVLARPGDGLAARMSPAARIYRDAKLKRSQAHLLARVQAPAWCFINVPMVDQSSRAIRAATGWGRGA